MSISLKNSIQYFLIFFLCILQISLPSSLFLFFSTPNFILAAIIVLIFLNDDKKAVMILALGGIVLDILSPARFGLVTLCLLVATFPIYFIIHQFIRQPSNLVIIFSILFGSLIFELLTNLFLAVPIDIKILVIAIENSLIGIIIFSIAKAYQKKLEPVKLS